LTVRLQTSSSLDSLVFATFLKKQNNKVVAMSLLISLISSYATVNAITSTCQFGWVNLQEKNTLNLTFKYLWKSKFVWWN